MRNKILSLLVLLLTAASGAWAQTVTWNSSTLSGINLYDGQSFTKDGVTLTALEGMIDGNWMGNSPNASFKFSTSLGNFTRIEITADIRGLGGSGWTQTSPGAVWTGEANETTFGMYFRNVSQIVFTIEPASSEPAVEVTTNAASEGATFTEASFQMPAFDATIDYEIVRDMSVSMPITVGDGNDGYRIRLKKNPQSGKFEPAETDVAGMMALIKVHDAIENEDLTFFNIGGAVDCSVNIYAIDAEDKPFGDPIAFPNLVPGRYIAKAVAATGSAYEGETTLSNIFVLFQGYEVIVPAGEYITYYKDEALYIENENAKLYTITEVGTETATATELSVAKANMPILVKNNDTQTQTILLIPTTNEADDVSAASEFIGTLTATTIAASSEDQNNYAFNGLQFVWVKNAIAVGANKAWLSINTGVPSARGITLVFDETTKIANTNITNITNGDWYDLNGRKLNGMPTKKGVYIMNGRKVVVK